MQELSEAEAWQFARELIATYGDAVIDFLDGRTSESSRINDLAAMTQWNRLRNCVVLILGAGSRAGLN